MVLKINMIFRTEIRVSTGLVPLEALSKCRRLDSPPNPYPAKDTPRFQPLESETSRKVPSMATEWVLPYMEKPGIVLGILSSVNIQGGLEMQSSISLWESWMSRCRGPRRQSHLRGRWRWCSQKQEDC